MRNRNCPDKDACWDYKASNCEGCAIGEKIARLVRQNKKLKAENANLRDRGPVAERALGILAHKIAITDLRDISMTATEKVKQKAIEQAEKELAEEKNNDSRRAGMV